MKPGNVLLGKDGSVKIADFGIARLCRDSMSRLTSQQDSGTLLYMAPEQLDGESGEASDIYSFGVMLYEMLAGDPPFLSGEITAQIRYKAPKEIEGLSPAMSRIVMKCLEKKPEQRFASVKELREELDGTADQRRALQSQTGPQVQTIPQPEPPRSGGGAVPTPPGEPDRRQRSAALKAKGNDAYNAGRFGEAIGAWQEALQLDPADTGLNEMLAGARKQADLVIQEAERKKAAQALQQWTDDVMARVNGLMQKGTYAEAANLLQQALQRVPGHVQISEQLSRVRQLLAPPAGPGGVAPVVPEKKPAKSRKKIWMYVGIGVAAFFVLGIIGMLMDSGKSSKFPEPGGGSIIDNPVTGPSDLAGNWGYTLLAAGGRIDGRVMISGSDNDLHLTTSTSYMYPGPDGMPHQVAESIEYEGSFDGQSLFLECVGGTVQMSGYPPAAPAGVGSQFTLAVSPDRRSIQGQVPVGGALGSLSMRKQ